jgi:alpha,alpha-trehalase
MLYYVVSLLSQIYCDGPILQAVQDARLFPDSKYFVDMPLKQDPGYFQFQIHFWTIRLSVTTLRDFYELGNKIQDPNVLGEFVDDHFDVPGQELVEVYPDDWVPFPNRFLPIFSKSNF